MNTAGPRHRGDHPDDVISLDGQWHVGHSYLGHFPQHEIRCPCPKARCGLAIPTLDIYCRDHYGERAVREAHTGPDCADHIRRHRKAMHA